MPFFSCFYFTLFLKYLFTCVCVCVNLNNKDGNLSLETAQHKQGYFCKYFDDRLVIIPYCTERLKEFKHHLNGLHGSRTFLDSLCSAAVCRHESGKCCSFLPFLTYFFVQDII